MQPAEAIIFEAWRTVLLAFGNTVRCSRESRSSPLQVLLSHSKTIGFGQCNNTTTPENLWKNKRPSRHEKQRNRCGTFTASRIFLFFSLSLSLSVFHFLNSRFDSRYLVGNETTDNARVNVIVQLKKDSADRSSLVRKKLGKKLGYIYEKVMKSLPLDS